MKHMKHAGLVHVTHGLVARWADAGLAALLLVAQLASAQLVDDAKVALADGTPPTAASAVAVTPGDPARGRLVFGSCRTCHYPDKAAGHQNGPNLWNIFGRQAGTQEGFAYYSEALKNSGIVWSPEYLDAWLADPRGFIPGTVMMTLGVPEAQSRADLIAYLMQFREAP